MSLGWFTSKITYPHGWRQETPITGNMKSFTGYLCAPRLWQLTYPKWGISEKASEEEVWVLFCHLVSKIAQYLFSFILFARSESLSISHFKRESILLHHLKELLKMHGHILKSAHPPSVYSNITSYLLPTYSSFLMSLKLSIIYLSYHLLLFKSFIYHLPNFF